MASEYVTFDDLVRFHRDVIVPDFEARLDAKLDARFSRFEAELDAKLDAKFDRFAADLDAKTEAKFDGFDAKFDTRLAPIIRHLSRLDDRIDAVHDELQATRVDMLHHFDSVYRRLDGLAIDFESMKGGMRRLEQRTDALETRVSRLEKKLP